MISINNLTIQYNNRCILKESNIQIPEGKITMILGVSGSGKTALLYRLGLINQSRDFEFCIDDMDVNHLIQKDKEKFISKNISYVLQTKNLIENSVYSNVEYAYKLINQNVNRDKILEELKTVDLANEINQSVDSLSEGQKQRLAILCAVIKKPKILILDEPTSALDKENSINILNIMSKLRDQGCTIIFTCHQLFAQEYADQIYLIENQELTLVKNCEENKKFLTIGVKNKISSIIFYIKSFFRRYTVRCSLIIGVISLIFAGFTFAVTYHDTIFEQGVQKVSGENHNEVLLKFKNNDQMFEALSKDPYVKTLYPYYESELGYYNPMIDETTIYSIFPVFKENDYTNYYLNNRNFNHEKGVFLSYYMFKDIEGENLKHLIMKNRDEFIVLETDGIMSASLRSCFIESNEYAIYMNNDLIKQYQVDDQMDGVIVFLKDIKDYNQFVKQYNVLESYTCTQKTTAMDSLYTAFQNYKTNLLMMVSIFVLGILLMMEYNYLHVRSIEFSIMKINGIETKSIQKILLLENGIHIVFSIIISYMIFLLCYHICSYFNLIIIPMNYLQTIEIIMITAIFTYCLIIAEFNIYLKMLDPEKVLRD